MNFYNTQFKCRCLPFLYQRISVTHNMNGIFKSGHISFINSTQPRGLHREYWRVIDITQEDIFNESNLKLIKYRKNHDFRNRWY